jgi:translation initiation factor IF-2
MSGILFKIAKEFNVATSTIVEYLTEKGFELENKPNARISKEMYEILAERFKVSAEVKEQADKLQIGTNYKKEAPSKPVFILPGSKEEDPEQKKVKEKKSASAKLAPKTIQLPAEPEVPVQKTEKKEGVIKAKAETPGLKVLGKIDLDKTKKKNKNQPKSEEKPDKPTEKDKKVEQEIKPENDKKSDKGKKSKDAESFQTEAYPQKVNRADKSEGEEVEEFRAKTPQLSGLKILGKIDTKKFEDDKEKKKKEQESKRAERSETKRKRKRKKVSVEAVGKRVTKTKNKSQKEEVKEVSQKEIEDQIKKTMARLSGGGKNKRQKIRRDSRDVKREKQELENLEKAEQEKVLKLTEFVSVSELASLMDVGVGDVITTCMNLGVIVSINQRLDAEIIELLATEFGYEVDFINAEESVSEDLEIEDDTKDLVPRAPIVTVMGHVDHGKTSLLDYIRSANVAEGEAGGITQHIGAYEVSIDNKKITFLDTPGHEAFTAMRARGAKVTDIVVVIIAADDKIMPQTKEAISHAQAAGVPIIFAINKIDKEGADPNRIKQELSGMNLLIEEWGGKIQSQDISAKTGLNVDLLLEKIALEAEILELKANPKRAAVGTVIEASLDKGKGYVTKVLVQKGTLKIGDPVVAGAHSGKVKAMENSKGKRIKSAGPSTPVMILGLSGAPQAGEIFKVAESEQVARSIAVKRAQIEREQTSRASKRISLDEIGRRLALGTFKELNLIVKGDVDGSIEALSDSLIKLSVETIQVNVIHKAVGQIAESDVLLASASDAIIIGFQVRPSSGARQLAEKEGVEIKTYSIIYEAIEEIKMAMEGMLEPTKEEKIMGTAEVRETYKISKIGTIAGCFVKEGKILRNNHIRLIRDGIVVYPTKEGANGEISSLKRFKDDVKEVKTGMECGISIKNFNDIKVGDEIEAYEIIEIQQTLS